jgi:hypothetical protein
MDPLTAIGLVGNIVQFVEFGLKLISKSASLYRSSEGTLLENSAIEAATAHLLILNEKLQDNTNTTGDATLERLCEKCRLIGEELQKTLKKVVVDKKGHVWTSVRKAIRSLWSKEQIEDLDKTFGWNSAGTYTLRGNRSQVFASTYMLKKS